MMNYWIILNRRCCVLLHPSFAALFGSLVGLIIISYAAFAVSIILSIGAAFCVLFAALFMVHIFLSWHFDPCVNVKIYFIFMEV